LLGGNIYRIPSKLWMLLGFGHVATTPPAAGRRALNIEPSGGWGKIHMAKPQYQGLKNHLGIQ